MRNIDTATMTLIIERDVARYWGPDSDMHYPNAPQSWNKNQTFVVIKDYTAYAQQGIDVKAAFSAACIGRTRVSLFGNSVILWRDTFEKRSQYNYNRYINTITTKTMMCEKCVTWYEIPTRETAFVCPKCGNAVRELRTIDKEFVPNKEPENARTRNYTVTFKTVKHYYVIYVKCDMGTCIEVGKQSMSFSRPMYSNATVDSDSCTDIDKICALFPDDADFLRTCEYMSLANAYSGVPMHHIANGFYFLRNRDNSELGSVEWSRHNEILAEHLRVSTHTASTIDCECVDEFAQHLVSDGYYTRWFVEAGQLRREFANRLGYNFV